MVSLFAEIEFRKTFTRRQFTTHSYCRLVKVANRKSRSYVLSTCGSPILDSEANDGILLIHLDEALDHVEWLRQLALKQLQGTQHTLCLHTCTVYIAQYYDLNIVVSHRVNITARTVYNHVLHSSVTTEHATCIYIVDRISSTAHRPARSDG